MEESVAASEINVSSDREVRVALSLCMSPQCRGGEIPPVNMEDVMEKMSDQLRQCEADRAQLQAR